MNTYNSLAKTGSRRMPRLISFALDLSICEARELSKREFQNQNLQHRPRCTKTPFHKNILLYRYTPLEIIMWSLGACWDNVS